MGGSKNSCSHIRLLAKQAFLFILLYLSWTWTMFNFASPVLALASFFPIEKIAHATLQ